VAVTVRYPDGRTDAARQDVELPTVDATELDPAPGLSFLTEAPARIVVELDEADERAGDDSVPTRTGRRWPTLTVGSVVPFEPAGFSERESEARLEGVTGASDLRALVVAERRGNDRDAVTTGEPLMPTAAVLARMDCRVVVEAAIPVYDVTSPEEAIRIAISKTGGMLNPDLSYVEISMGSRTSPDGEELPPAFIAADEALVALELEMTVFNVEREEHASRIARKEIGQRLENVPLKVLSVERVEGDDAGESESEPEPESDSASDADAPAEGSDGDGEDLIPEFDDLVEDG
jgi:uncharacterized protein (UPF0212 family)